VMMLVFTRRINAVARVMAINWTREQR